MHPQATNYNGVKSTDCSDCEFKNKEIKFSYNPKEQGVSDSTYVPADCNGKSKDNVKVCGLPKVFSDGSKPECVNPDETPCKRWTDDTIEKAMNETWKCVTSVNNKPFEYNITIEAPKDSNVESFDNKDCNPILDKIKNSFPILHGSGQYSCIFLI